MKEVPLYLHRETQEVVIIMQENEPLSKTSHYTVQENTTPPKTTEEAVELWLQGKLKKIPVQPTSQLWPLNYPNNRPNQAEVPMK